MLLPRWWKYGFYISAAKQRSHFTISLCRTQCFHFRLLRTWELIIENCSCFRGTYLPFNAFPLYYTLWRWFYSLVSCSEIAHVLYNLLYKKNFLESETNTFHPETSLPLNWKCQIIGGEILIVKMRSMRMGKIFLNGNWMVTVPLHIYYC